MFIFLSYSNLKQNLLFSEQQGNEGYRTTKEIKVIKVWEIICLICQFSLKVIKDSVLWWWLYVCNRERDIWFPVSLQNSSSQSHLSVEHSWLNSPNHLEVIGWRLKILVIESFRDYFLRLLLLGWSVSWRSHCGGRDGVEISRVRNTWLQILPLPFTKYVILGKWPFYISLSLLIKLEIMILVSQSYFEY